jgi:nucleotide-binding universal stress UspA family protein
MSKYNVVVVGTDGSETSFRAVERAASIAGSAGAKLIIASAFLDKDHGRAGPDPDQPPNEGYKTQGNASVYEMLRTAASRAREAGATDVEERAIEGAPVEALLQLAEDSDDYYCNATPSSSAKTLIMCCTPISLRPMIMWSCWPCPAALRRGLADGRVRRPKAR